MQRAAKKQRAPSEHNKGTVKQMMEAEVALVAVALQPLANRGRNAVCSAGEGVGARCTNWPLCLVHLVSADLLTK